MIVEPIPNSNRDLIIDDRLLDWIAVRIPQVGADHGWHGKAHAIGIGANGRIMAAMAVTGVDRKNWCGELSVAADDPSWATRSALRAFLRYPFEQLKLGRVTAVCAASNERAINFNLRLGFRQEGILRRGLKTEDAVVMGLLREEADRWLQSPSDSCSDRPFAMAATA